MMCAGLEWQRPCLTLSTVTFVPSSFWLQMYNTNHDQRARILIPLASLSHYSIINILRNMCIVLSNYVVFTRIKIVHLHCPNMWPEALLFVDLRGELLVVDPGGSDDCCCDCRQRWRSLGSSFYWTRRLSERSYERDVRHNGRCIWIKRCLIYGWGALIAACVCWGV